MHKGIISVLLIGTEEEDLQLALDGCAPYEASDFYQDWLYSDESISEMLAGYHFDVICTFGNASEFPELHEEPLEIRKRWVHFDGHETPVSEIADAVMATYINNATKDRFPETPLISVFTPTYKTGPQLLRPYESLLDQTYDNWEWIIYDDSPDDATFRVASSLAGFDHRIKVFKSHEPCGQIGEVKRRACGLAGGSIFVELDHDDELTPNCLLDIVSAFRANPEAGFAYTDCAEVLENGENATYGETYAFGFGSYRYEEHGGRTYAVSNYPSVNAKTVRHIVGMPNHARAWTRDAYYLAGGHSGEIHVADDYELCVRTFLTTRMVHIKKLGYIQHINTNGSNTQRVRNKEIQRLVRFFANRYETEIHNRFIELGVDDFIWTIAGLDWSLDPSDNYEANLTFDECTEQE